MLFRGKFWVFGGSTGDDSYDHTITDKVQAYNPRTQAWSVEKSLSSPRHKVGGEYPSPLPNKLMYNLALVVFISC